MSKLMRSLILQDPDPAGEEGGGTGEKPAATAPTVSADDFAKLQEQVTNLTTGIRAAERAKEKAEQEATKKEATVASVSAEVEKLQKALLVENKKNLVRPLIADAIDENDVFSKLDFENLDTAEEAKTAITAIRASHKHYFKSGNEQGDDFTLTPGRRQDELLDDDQPIGPKVRGILRQIRTTSWDGSPKL